MMTEEKVLQPIFDKSQGANIIVSSKILNETHLASCFIDHNTATEPHVEIQKLNFKKGIMDSQKIFLLNQIIDYSCVNNKNHKHYFLLTLPKKDAKFLQEEKKWVKIESVESREEESFMLALTLPLSWGIWNKIIMNPDFSFDKRVFDLYINPLLQAMIFDTSFPHTAQRSLEEADYVYFLSDLHADPNNFIKLMVLHEVLPEKPKDLSGIFQWRKKNKGKKSVFLILGDLLDGRRNDMEVDSSLSISNEYQLLLTIMTLRLSAHREGDEVFFCMGNHDVWRSLGLMTISKYKDKPVYITEKDRLFLADDNALLEDWNNLELQFTEIRRPSGRNEALKINLLDKASGVKPDEVKKIYSKHFFKPYEAFFESSPHFYFLFSRKKNHSSETNKVYAAHAELFLPTENAQVVHKNLQVLKKAEQEWRAGEKSLNSILFSLLTGIQPFTKRVFYLAYLENKTLDRPVIEGISAFVAGHTKVDGKNIEAHHNHVTLKNFYYFVDQGLSDCFQKLKKQKDEDRTFSLLELNRESGVFTWRTKK